MRNTYIIIFCFFIFGIMIFLGNKFLNFGENKNFLEVGEEEIITPKYNSQEDTKILHGGNYIQDNGIIKYRDEILKNVDIESFEYLTGSYAKDENNYFFEGKIIYISDGISQKGNFGIGENFEILSGNYAKDENYLFYNNFGFLQHNNKKMTFIPEKIEENHFKYFVKIGDEIYYGNQKQNQIDKESFSHLEYNYYQDKNGIYFGNNLLTLSKNYYKIIDEKFIKDDRNVFLKGEYKPQLDAKSFKKLEVPENHMYFLDLYSDTNGFYTFNQYSHNFYKLKNNISQENIKKCLNNENFCKSVLGY